MFVWILSVFCYDFLLFLLIFDIGDWVSNVVYGFYVFLLNKMNIDV